MPRSRPRRHSPAPALLLVGALGFAACSSDAEQTSIEASAPPLSAPADAEPAVTEPPPTEPPATEPPPTEPPPTEPPATEPPATEAPTPAFELIGPGPYDVGVTTVTIPHTGVDQADRPLTVDIWFPLAEGTTGDLHRYTLLPGVFYESPAALSVDAGSISADGPFPLVVYSHGSGGLRYIHSSYTEALASYGYVVAAPDHTGNTAVERLAGTDADFDLTALNRPNDVGAVINEMLNPESTITVGFVAAVDPERIAVTGHSFGGFTTYAMISGYENPLGEFAPDSRVDAIIPLAPATGDDTRLLADADLAAVDVPALVMVGADDRTTPVDPNVTRAWELTRSSPHVRVELVAGEHQTFTDLCDYQAFLPTLPDVPQAVTDTIIAFGEEGCSEGDMPIDRAKDLTNTFAVRFLESVFRDGPPIDARTEFPDDVVVMIKPS